MAEIDRIKEELGWLKVVFAISAAVNVSLIAWLAQNYANAGLGLASIAALMAIFLTVALIWINRAAIQRFKRLGD